MGQALRRATGRVPSSKAAAPAEAFKNAERRPPVAPAPSETSTGAQDRLDISDSEGISKVKVEQNLLEERDPGYDAMLSKLVGSIKSKPGGKLEMGEAFVVEKYNRPMPKLRSSKAEAEGSEQKPLPPGTLTATQLQEIILLHQGKSAEHQGPMEVHDIAKRFRIDATHVERIVQFLSTPPEDHNKKTQQ